MQADLERQRHESERGKQLIALEGHSATRNELAARHLFVLLSTWTRKGEWTARARCWHLWRRAVDEGRVEASEERIGAVSLLLASGARLPASAQAPRARRH